MLITSVHVANFRSIEDAKIDCDHLTVLIGRNGAGKSNFLRALDAFYDVSAPITAEDFFGRDTTDPIEIRVTFGSLTEAEAAEFAAYVRNEVLTVTKKVALETGRLTQKYYGAAMQNPEFAKIRAMASKTERRAEWKKLVDAGALPELSGNPKNADEVEALMTAYEDTHPESLEVVEREEQFFGPRNVGGGKLDKYTKFVLVPAVREAAEEVGGRKGAIPQILDTLVLRKLTAREDVRTFREEFERRARDLFGPATEDELQGVARSLTGSLSTFAPGASLHLSWDEVSVPDVQPPATRVTVVEDEFEGDIDRKGHGLQRALVLTLLRELAMLSPPASSEDLQGQEVAASSDGSAPQVPDLILAIEEPELFLHPSRCRYLSRLLLQLASKQEGQPGNQIFYTTHSPHFVDLRWFDQVRRVQKTRPIGPGIPATAVTRFTLEEAAQELARACGSDPATFTRESFAARALPVMSQLVHEGFLRGRRRASGGPVRSRRSMEAPRNHGG